MRRRPKKGLEIPGLSVTLMLLFSTGCPGEGSSATDAAVGSDAGLDAAVGSDAGLDAAVGSDAGLDAAVDAGSDAGREWPTPVPTAELPAYFADRGLEHSGPFGLAGEGTDYLYVPFRDPADDEVLLAFFEIDTGTAMDTDGMHFAAGLRGPDPTRTIPHYGGRGLAFGSLASFEACSGRGYFIEDYTLNTLVGRPAMQHTYCQDHPFTANTRYRVDMRVSTSDTAVTVWRVSGEASYTHELSVACTTEPGPSRAVGPCPEHATDVPFGGFFVGSAFPADTDTWAVSDVFVAVEDE